jgi:hypothetical protein
MPAAFSVETRSATRNTPPFADIDEKSDISFLIEIFRGLIAPFTLFYTPKVVHAAISVKTSSPTRNTPPFVDFEENYNISFQRETIRR